MNVVDAVHTKSRRIGLGLRALAPRTYAQDGLLSVHSHAFMKDSTFIAAYARGVKAIGGADLYEWHWRVHIGLWAASIASRLDGELLNAASIDGS